jgi:hypothetical protein
MSITETPKPPAKSDDTLTVVSIAALAFIFADLAHEGLGHGFGFYFAGGKSCMLTTTRLIEWVALPDPEWRVFDLGGPSGSLVIALLALIGLRFLPTRPVALRFFLWLVTAFTLFWTFGYLIFSGVTGRGDWMALLQGTPILTTGRIAFVVLGMVLYRLCITLCAKELRGIFSVTDANAKSRISRLIWLSYIAGGLIACAGATLDPRGPLEILKSGALSSFGAAVGLPFVAQSSFRLPERQLATDQPISYHLAWILAAAAACLYYIAILGPGILMYFEH